MPLEVIAIPRFRLSLNVRASGVMPKHLKFSIPVKGSARDFFAGAGVYNH